jgi:hypothetical protein
MCVIFLGDSQYPEQADHVQETGRGSADCHHHRSPAGGQPTSGPHILSQSRGKTALKPQVLCVILYLFFLTVWYFTKYFFHLPYRILQKEFSRCRDRTRAIKQFSLFRFRFTAVRIRIQAYNSIRIRIRKRNNAIKEQICYPSSWLLEIFVGFCL